MRTKIERYSQEIESIDPSFDKHQPRKVITACTNM